MCIRTIVRRLRFAITRKATPPLGDLSPRGAVREGPPAIAIGRLYAAETPDITIEPFETEFRVKAGQVLVRAWIAMPDGEVPPATLTMIGFTAQKLQHLPPTVRRILFLSISYRLTTAEIAILLGMSRWKTRRLLLRGIAALDGRALTRADRRAAAACTAKRV